MLSYSIFKTRLSNETKFVARIWAKEVYDQAQLVERMLEVGTSVSRGDVDSVLNLLKTTVAKLCCEGFGVALDSFVRFLPAIGGTFEGEGDGYLTGRNSVYVNATMSSTFNDRFNLDVIVGKVSPSSPAPRLFSVDDLASGTNNQTVTKANIVTLAGERLKFDPTNEEEYLHFVDDSDPSRFLPITKFQRMSDRALVFLMPEAPFAQGYFELANGMNTTRVRTERSAVVGVAA